jgi:energy-coupling factor transporter ATP-binding protein EcfA2
MTLPEPLNITAGQVVSAIYGEGNKPAGIRVLPSKFKNLPKPTKEDLAEYSAEKVPFFAWLQATVSPYGIDSRPYKTEIACERLADEKDPIVKKLRKTNTGAEARCPYFVPNGGGQKKEQITDFNAFFFEIDDKPLEEQWALAMSLPIAPHIIIATKSSLHCYWLAKQGTTGEEWDTVERTLIISLNSDPTIRDRSRVMRLPGYDHTTFDYATGKVSRVPVTVRKFDVDARITAADMLAWLSERGTPAVSEKAFQQWLQIRNAANKTKRQAARQKETGSAAGKPLFDGEAPADLKARHSAICERLGAPTTTEGETLRAVCPSCGDPNPSFVMMLTADAVKVFCHALCTLDDLCESLGIERKHLLAKSQDDESGTAAEDGPTIAQMLIDLALGNSELFHDAGGDCFASVSINGHRETHKLNSREFKDWLAGLLYKKSGRAAGGDKLGEAITVLRAKARYEAEEIDTHVRVAEHDGKIYLDLCDKEWRQVEIGQEGWRLIASIDSPVRFRRAGGMLPLPEPKRGGELCELRELLNLPAEDKQIWPLLLAWLVAALKPCNVERFPYPLLAVHGEQGSAKSTLCRLLRRLIDPNKADLRATAKDERDLAIAAEHGRILAFDNLTYLNDSLSNALCRLATGGGFATRELFSDEGEVIFDSQRPVILNGIAEVIAKSDLLDRSIFFYLPRIDPKRRKQERVVNRKFAEIQPGVLGALLTAVSSGLKRLKEGVELDELPRMADFAEWAVACEKGLGLEPGEFLNAYKENQIAANGLAIEASPVAQAIISFIKDCHFWKGTTGGLKKALDGRLEANEENPKKKHGWPSSPRKLGATLKEIVPNLRRNGLRIEFGERGAKGYEITIAESEAAEPQKDGKDVHNVHDVHTANDGNGLGREHVDEHLKSEQSEMFTTQAAGAASEHVGNGFNGNVHANVHTVNGSKQTASEHREHREYVLPIDGAEGGKDQTVASVPFMITSQMRQQLHHLGWKDSTIDKMKPAEAWEVINAAKPKEQSI